MLGWLQLNTCAACQLVSCHLLVASALPLVSLWSKCPMPPRLLPSAGNCGNCSDSQAGTRLVLTASYYYKQPCKTSGVAAKLPKCELFFFTGKRNASSCAGETRTCYIAVKRGASIVYVIDRTCSSKASNIARPGNPACPLPGVCVQVCTRTFHF